jgi:hypothetical protein
VIETNIRIVIPGPKLYLDTRYVQLMTSDNLPDLPQRVCSELRIRHGLAAVSPSDVSGILLIAARDSIQVPTLGEGDWHAEVRDSGQPRRLRFAIPEDSTLLAQLLERCLLIELGRRTDLWTLDSPRIWYESEPFRIADDDNIAAYRRFEVSAVPIKSTGVGLVVDVGTAFFTVQTAAYFFADDLSGQEQKQRQEWFDFLSRRQNGQRATLLYDLGKSKHKCYFAEPCPGVTCATTGRILVRGREYNSLFDYYQQTYSYLQVLADDPVVRVSFPLLDRPQFVGARMLRLRVMNESLSEDLKQVDKIDPADRCKLAEGFWELLGDNPLGRGKPKIEPDFWQPKSGQIKRVKPPDLAFADGRIIPAPRNGRSKEYQKYYRQRSDLLDKVGCLDIPPTVTRVVHVAVPRKTEESMSTRLAEDIVARLSGWTRRHIDYELLKYDSLDEGLSRLNSEVEPGVVVFVFEDDDPATYFTVSRELKAWRIKRITYDRLENQFAQLLSAEDRVDDSGDTSERIARRWYSRLIEPSALDVLQQMGCVPWELKGQLHYEAQLAIDVGWDRRYFALSLLICRSQSGKPSFLLDTVVYPKPDIKRETINEVILRDKIVALFQRARMKRRNFDPVHSVLILRDGRECGRELEGISAAREGLIRSGILDKEAQIDVVDVHKYSAKGIRLWYRNQVNQVEQVLEGSALFLNERTVVIANTGAATIRQGTVEPIMLEARGNGIDMDAVTTDVHAKTHLNWSSPSVAQRLSITLKQTDDELKKREAQEIRRI